MSWERPQYPETSYGLILESYKSGRKSLWETVGALLTRFPQATYPVGEEVYWESVEEYGKESWYAPHNIWRQVCHFEGGFFLSLFSPLSPDLTVILLGVIISLSEAYQIYSTKLITLKNLFDVLAWVGGSSGALLIRMSLEI